jgi:hypothetical protein
LPPEEELKTLTVVEWREQVRVEQERESQRETNALNAEVLERRARVRRRLRSSRRASVVEDGIRYFRAEFGSLCAKAPRRLCLATSLGARVAAAAFAAVRVALAPQAD